MNPGDPVEINQVWGGGSVVPYRHWFRGYIFIRSENQNGIVTADSGIYQGIEIRYPIHDIRLSEIGS